MAVINYTKMLKKADKLPIFTDIDTLDLYCEYLLNYSNKSINFSNLSNLYDYISRMDEDKIKTNEAKFARYLFVKHYLDARLKKGVASPKICFKYIEDRVSKKYWAIIKREIIDSLPHNNMSSDDVAFVNNLVYSQLNTVFMHGYKDAIMKIMEDLNSGEFGKDSTDCDNAIELFQNILNELSKAQRRSKKNNRFNLTDEEEFNIMMQEAIDRAQSGSHFLITGWQGLNNMLGGGFEDARLYNFIGSTGGFKSGLLLNLMKQLKLYNKGRPHKDPTKRPTILFLSQENNIWETFLRIYGIFGGTGSIREHDLKDVVKMLKNGGFGLVSDEFDIDIEFRYYGNFDIGVNDIKGMIQELDASGREVICVIQDYIERLRPPIMSADKRLQLADVSNQLHDFAQEADIPIITASQFNREGASVIEEGKERGIKDIAKRVGTGNVSESFSMLKNIDVNIGIVVEYDSSEERYYLSFRALKFRGDDTNSLKYFLQPFVGKNNKIQLMDDINTEPVYRLSMLDEVAASIETNMDEMAPLTRREVSLLKPINEVESETISEFTSQVFDDIDRSGVDQSDNMLRDDNGFIILIHKKKLNECVDIDSFSFSV